MVINNKISRSINLLIFGHNINEIVRDSGAYMDFYDFEFALYGFDFTLLIGRLEGVEYDY